MLVKRKTLPKRCRAMIQELEREECERVHGEKPLPVFGPGDVVSLQIVTPENRRRVSTLKGIVIGRRNRGLGSSFTLRYVVGEHPFERTFPLYSPHVLSLEVLEQRKVRRSKLYYLREQGLKHSRV